MENLNQKVMEAVGYIRSSIPLKPDVAIILGSGLESLAYEIQDSITIPFGEIPYFKSSDFGSENKLVFGKIYNKNVVALMGRLHYYDGYDMDDIVFPIRVFALLGVETLIVTNSAAGVNPSFNQGDIMLITDHINLSGVSPLHGPNPSIFGSRFPVMRGCYHKELANLARRTASEMGITLQEGVYAFLPGPELQTDAEIKMLNMLGASAVGMSTVPEVIAARHSGIDVLGLSYIIDVTGEYGRAPVNNEFFDDNDNVIDNFKAIIMDTIKKIDFENEG